MPLRPAVFLDRDGTLNAQIVRNGKPYAPARLEDFKVLDGVPEACAALKASGFILVVATNQPDVGRGQVAREVIESMHAALLEAIPVIDRVEVCYDPGTGEISTRRKPEPGMLLEAAALLGIDLPRSWMVGDRWKDVDCGKRAGVRTVFIDCGYDERLHSVPDHIVKSFKEAADCILSSLRNA
ncbi:MAG TPA: HAD-IIIA family hydrolase [Opitutaceae bacterium]|jgi:D-glycero-D-manno-heptose 1,7-bisphosphate phosphatase